MRKFILLLLIIGISIFFASSLYAQNSQTASLNVSATVVPACSVSAQDINFGDLSGAGNVYADGNIQVICSDGLEYFIALGGGLNPEDSNRNMADPANQNLVSYNLFQDPGYTVQWGDAGYDNTFPGGQVLADIGNGIPQDHDVLGVANMMAIVPPGSYSDVVQVTVWY